MEGNQGAVGSGEPRIKLGPDGFNKIALLGSAPSSLRMAPFHDKSWAMWGCSPGVYGAVPYRRTDVWFELHRYEPPIAGDPQNAVNRPWFSPEYVQFLKEHEGPVYLSHPDILAENPVPAIKNGFRFPDENYRAKFGPFHFTSSIAWMLAHAIETLVEKRLRRDVPNSGEAIGLWGIDMAHHTEYMFQRPGCQHFLGLAKSLGIDVILPLESDLMQPPLLYGICEYHPRYVKLNVRRAELELKKSMLSQQVNNANVELMHVNGALDNIKYVMDTWADDQDPGMDITSAVSLAGVAAGRPEAAKAALESFLEPGIGEVGSQNAIDAPTATKTLEEAIADGDVTVTPIAPTAIGKKVLKAIKKGAKRGK